MSGYARSVRVRSFQQASHFVWDYLKPFGPAFKPLGKKTPTAGLASAFVDVLYDAPPVTMFKTWLVLREKAITLVESASTIRVAVTFGAPASTTENK